MENAITWSKTPWITMKPSGTDKSTFYAYDACHPDPAAIATWNDLHVMMVDKYNLDAYVVHDHRTSDADTDSPHDSWRPCRSRSPRRCNLADGPRGARTSGHRAPSDPDTRSSGHAPTRGSGNDRRSSRQEPSAGSGIDRRSDSHPIYYDRPSDHADSTSERGHFVLPPYATLEPDAAVWWNVMRELEVDDQATRQLFALAQYGDDGCKAANSIIGKFSKARVSVRYTTRPSRRSSPPR